jgi:hypothetical protein
MDSAPRPGIAAVEGIAAAGIAAVEEIAAASIAVGTVLGPDLRIGRAAHSNRRAQTGPWQAAAVRKAPSRKPEPML